MSQFIPPSFNLPFAWSVDLSFPVLLKLYQNVDGIEISSEDRKTLRSLRKDRLLFFSNHPSTAEPPIAYHVAQVMGARFRYMASRQVFDRAYGIIGRIIQNVGAFSVIAGATDREALKTARGVLAAPSGKLVLYPEGEPTSGENDNLLPFQPGIAQLGFWGLDDARKVDPEGDVTVLPAFIKYVYTGTEARIKSDLHSSLSRIERRFKIDPGNKNLLRRFLTVGRVLLEQAEAEYNVVPASRTDFDYRVGRVRHTILDAVATRFSIPAYEYNADAIVKLRRLLAVLEMVRVGVPDSKLQPMSAADLEWADRECQKAYDFIVIKPEYPISRPTAERLYEWLYRFETYVYGSSNPRPRRAHVSLATPFYLSEYYAQYQKKKRAGLDAVLDRLRREMQALLEQSLDLSMPLVRPYDVGDDVM